MNTKSKCNSKVCKGAVRIFLVFEADRIAGNKMGIMVHKCEECMAELPSKIPLKERLKNTLKERMYRLKRRTKTIIGEFNIVRKSKWTTKVLPITFHTNTEAENYMKKTLGSTASRYYRIEQKI